MWSPLLLVVACCVSFLLVACSATGEYAPQNIAERPIYLDDCTESVSYYFGWDAPQVPQKARQDLVAAASAWAFDNRFAPCDYRMCATIRDYSDVIATVYVSYDVAEPVEAHPTGEGGLKEIIMRIGPEAEVTFDLETFDVLEDGFWHSGCRFGE